MNGKFIKKVVVGLMAMVMLVGTFLGPAKAEASSVIGQSPSTGSLTIKKTDGTDPLKDAVFTLYKIMDLTPGASAGDYASYSIVSHYSSVLAGVTPDDFGNYSAAQIEAKANEILEKTATDTGIAMSPTGADGKSKKDGLALGYYMVVETSAPDGYVAGKPFFVAIPSTNNYDDKDEAGTAWEYDVEVEPKNEEVTVEKNVITGKDENGNYILSPTETATIGDDIPFVVETTIPNFADEYFESDEDPIFMLKDKMTDGLEFDDQSVKVYKVASDGTTETEVTESATTWELDTTDTTVDFTLSFVKVFLKENRGTTVRIYYAAELTEDAVVGLTGDGNKNEVELSYSNNPQNVSDTATVPGPDNKIYTFGVKIVKFAKVDGTSKTLKGAEFGLYTDAECTTAVFSPATVTTGDDGIINFTGLKAGTYYLKETKSPEGYKLLANPIKVVITATKGTDGELDGKFKIEIDGKEVTETTGELTTIIDENAGISTIAVENQRGFTLPATGGMGVAIFLLIGIGGVVLLSLVMMKKRRTE